MSKEENRIKWIEKARSFTTVAVELLIIWEHLDREDNDTTSVNYPFSASFDEEVHAFYTWLEDIEEKWGKNGNKL